MIASASICFPPVTYMGSDDWTLERRERQIRAWELWQLAKGVGPVKLELHLGCATKEDQEYAERLVWTDEMPRPFLLPRNGTSVFGRPLPYVRDLMDAAGYLSSFGYDNDYWIGLFNNDIMVELPMMRLIAAAPSDLDAILVHRIDVDDPSGSNPVLDHKSVDGWLIKESVWSRLRKDRTPFPDFLLGEPGWGYASTIWCCYQNLNVCHIDGLCWHVRHEAVWKKRHGAAYRHNQNLYQRLVRKTGVRGLRLSQKPEITKG